MYVPVAPDMISPSVARSVGRQRRGDRLSSSEPSRVAVTESCAVGDAGDHNLAAAMVKSRPITGGDWRCDIVNYVEEGGPCGGANRRASFQIRWHAAAQCHPTKSYPLPLICSRRSMRCDGNASPRELDRFGELLAERDERIDSRRAPRWTV